jgi:hypothetical protein
MGWGTTFTTDIYVSRKHLRNAHDVHFEIEEVKSLIRMYEDELLILAGMTPSSTEGDLDSVIQDIRVKVRNVLDEYTDYIYYMSDLEKLLQHLENGGEVLID